MRMLELIAAKRDGAAHRARELDFLARGAADGSIPDYQLAAWLMAVRLNGMAPAETAALTRAMAAHGRRLRASPRPRADKHSTGGVGDGVSLALAPLAAAAGLVVPMMSGRGLGHTGGTLDKLEAVRGLEVGLGPPAVERQLSRIGVCMFGQGPELAPADRRLYALRDATAAVDSTPLIVSSILSKKLAEGLDALILDVKCGSGAIFSSRREAEALARELLRVARMSGLRAAALLTDMEQPLGLAVGDALEMRQAVAVLRGGGPTDFRELTLALGGWMLFLCRRARSPEQGAARIARAIEDGSGLAKLAAMIGAQGGDARVVSDPERFLPCARLSRTLKAALGGWVYRLDARAVGLAAAALGAGRSRQEDAVDHGAGILLARKIGDPVRPGAELMRLYSSDAARLSAAQRLLEGAVAVSPRRPPARPVVLKVIR